MDDQTLVNKLEELVVDENKIVTCQLFSQQYNLEMPKSKQILKLFSENVESTKNCKICYILTGFVNINNTKIYRIVLSNNDELANAKLQFTNLLSCSVFSVQKIDIKDSGLLYASQIVEQSDSFLNKSPTIKSASIVIRSSEQTPAIIPQEIEIEEIAINKKTNDLKATTAKSNDIKGSLADAFAKTTTSKTSTKKSPDSVVTSTKASNKKPVSIAAAFAKMPPKKSPLPQIEEKVNIEKVTLKLKGKSKGNKKVKKVVVKEEEPERDILSSSSDEEEIVRKPAKKMRRIIAMDDSDSDMEVEYKSKENEVESQTATLSSSDPNDLEDPLPKRKTPLSDKESQNIIASVPGKHMEFKTVTNTFMDNEGFLVTKSEKKMVEVNDDPDDPVLPSTKTKLKESPPLSTNQKKQSTLSSFFKRKI